MGERVPDPGLLFWRRFGQVLNAAHKGASYHAVTIVLGVAILLLVRLVRDDERRAAAVAAIERQPVLGALWRGTPRPRAFIVRRFAAGPLRAGG